MKRPLFYALICMPVFFAACASGVQNLRKVDPGMAPADVEKFMGKRDSFSSAEHEGHTYILHRYTNRLCNGHVSLQEKCDFYVVYRDGAVIETGVSAVRTIPSNMQFLYLFRMN